MENAQLIFLSGFNVLPGECPALQSPPWMDKPSTYLTVEEKVALSPIVVQGKAC